MNNKNKQKIKPAPQEKPAVVKTKQIWPGQKISLSLDAQGFQNILDQARLRGFREGVKYIVTLAEGFLAKGSKLKPAWWIATLVSALHYEPSYALITPKKAKPGRPALDEPDEAPLKEAEENASEQRPD